VHADLPSPLGLASVSHTCRRRRGQPEAGEDLTIRIIAAGHRIGHAYALSAMTFADGRISLDNGMHRWAVAVRDPWHCQRSTYVA
jgi:hypothetical protein